MRLQAEEPVHASVARSPRRPPWTAIIAAIVVVLTAIVAIAAWRIEEPLRRYVERRVNESLTGYTVSIGALHLHIVGLAVELENVSMVQNARPSPPMLYLPSWRTSVEWRALLSLALVADTTFQRPNLYITLEQTEQEVEDKTKLTDRGWQDAVQAVYPLKINTFRIVDGTISYYDVGRVPPLEFEHVDFRATNIRNARSMPGTYPSPVQLRASVLGGSVTADGHADFLAKPYPTLDTNFDLQKANLVPMAPMVRRFDLVLSKGMVGASGRLVLETKQTTVSLDRVLLSEPAIEYVRDPRPEARQIEKAVVVATQAATEPGVRVAMQDVRVENGTFDLKVDALRSADGKMLIAQAKDLPPLRLEKLDLHATDISSERLPKRAPTRFELQTNILGDGRLGVKGTADLLAEPHATGTADIDLSNVRLDPFAGLARHWAFELSGGTLAAAARLDVGQEQTALLVHRITATDPSVSYVVKTQKDEERLDRAKRAATTPEAKPAFRLDVEDAGIGGGTFVYIREAATPPYRLALTHADVGVRGFSNQQSERRGSATLRGRFMESGKASIDATFASATKQPDFDMKVRLESVQLTELNDLLRATGGFDVVAGQFSFYSEITVQNGRVKGYVKPFFEGLDVYDRAQDKGKGIGKQAYEAMVGAAGTLLENRGSDQVATEADLSGPIEDPNAPSWQIVVGLVRNAFWRALLPGLDPSKARR
jgi:Domain of Unknown Function (DUF748)